MKIFRFPLRRRAGPFVLAALFGFSVAPLIAGSPGRGRVVARSMMSGFAAVPLAADELRANEKAFLTAAVSEARQQLRLAEVGASNAASSEVRSQALTLAGDYRDLTASLEALIRRKGGVAGAPTGGTSENYQKLLGKSGADFDREFIRVASELGSDVMTLFETAAAESRDADVRAFAAAQLPVLRAHRNAMAELKKTI